MSAFETFLAILDFGTFVTVLVGAIGVVSVATPINKFITTNS
ncbi:hypothetical protein GCM10025886_13660 [Tetragenococcus halophilus subsp. flandriensis]|nr:hypothetical protein [Tetragenococcus halophilus]GMA08215.1 hypothetical protein GCM10025886_13660 [Tetragenococcus halophilus subsp. flandriensis]